MAIRRAVQCATCGHPYAARLVSERVILPTNGGKCTCGSDEFEEVQETPDATGEMEPTEPQG